MEKTKVILDLDMGIDDALALAYVVGNPRLELIGVMASFGNVSCALSARNCADMLDMLGHPEIPVYAGATRALSGSDPYEGAPGVHGSNGLGDVEIPHGGRRPVCVREPDGEAAVAFLLDAARTHGPSLAYVPTGPLTNLARALARDRAALMRIGSITLMGGALTVPGNEGPTHAAEANIYADPEAAAEVFASDAPLMVIGLDVTHQVALSRAEADAWRGRGAAGTALADIVSFYIKAYERSMPWLGGSALHDPLAAAVAADPTLVDAMATRLLVELDGPDRGRTVQDPRCLCEPGRRTTRVALAVDRMRFKRDFGACIDRALSRARSTRGA